MKPISFPEQTSVIANSELYKIPVPVHVCQSQNKEVTTKWQLTDVEIDQIIKTRSLFITSTTLGQFPQPLIPSVFNPLVELIKLSEKELTEVNLKKVFKKGVLLYIKSKDKPFYEIKVAGDILIDTRRCDDDSRFVMNWDKFIKLLKYSSFQNKASWYYLDPTV